MSGSLSAQQIRRERLPTYIASRARPRYKAGISLVTHDGYSSPHHTRHPLANLARYTILSRSPSSASQLREQQPLPSSPQQPSPLSPQNLHLSIYEIFTSPHTKYRLAAPPHNLSFRQLKEVRHSVSSTLFSRGYDIFVLRLPPPRLSIYKFFTPSPTKASPLLLQNLISPCLVDTHLLTYFGRYAISPHSPPPPQSSPLFRCGATPTHLTSSLDKLPTPTRSPHISIQKPFPSLLYDKPISSPRNKV